ncbi:hypothetical protein [Salmonirosea aquatica]|uniref:Uncharacterized protein n=1 Tax=Salmonirosea aquatica TaxID=2654236 RepID=A0A7C9FZ27_9BACT|nr:hypothetical protein [Cytophagaceae bacterium SJW1-29]
MERFLVILVVLLCGGLAANAQTVNPWLDSTQINHSKVPLIIANGIVTNTAELNPDFISSVYVVKDRQAEKGAGCLSDNGCIYVEADQQFDIITPRMYQSKKNLPSSVRTVVFMLNGTMVSDTLRISKGSIRRVDVLLGSNHPRVPVDSACLSIWTLSNEERGIPEINSGMRIRGPREAGE